MLANLASAAMVAQGLGSALTVLGTASQLMNERDAAEAAEEYSTARQRITEVETKRRREEFLRKQRVEQARVANVAAQTGTAGSSGAIGAIQSITGQTAQNLGFMDVTSQLAWKASERSRRAAQAQSRAKTAQALTKLTTRFADFSPTV